MTEDPKGFAAGDYNLFRYCKNDPEDLTDPMGLAPGTGAAEALYTLSTLAKAGTRTMITGSNLPQNANQQFPGALPYYHATPIPNPNRALLHQHIGRDFGGAEERKGSRR